MDWLINMGWFADHIDAIVKLSSVAKDWAMTAVAIFSFYLLIKKEKKKACVAEDLEEKDE